jgi:hypothetical protein
MYRLKNYLILLILVTLISGSCKNSLKNDQSLKLKEYLGAGIPDPTKLWASEAYLQTITTLKTIRRNNFQSLPRKASRRSGVVFKNFVNKENLSFLDEGNLSLSEKAHLVKYFPSLQSDLKRMYTDESKTEQYYSEELIDIYIFGLFIYEKMLDLADKMQNPDVSVNVDMKSGLQKVMYGYLNMVVKDLDEQVKSNIYEARDLDSLSLAISSSLIKNKGWIRPADIQTISAKIQNTIDKSSSDYIKDNYRKALEELNSNR